MGGKNRIIYPQAWPDGRTHHPFAAGSTADSLIVSATTTMKSKLEASILVICLFLSSSRAFVSLTTSRPVSAPRCRRAAIRRQASNEPRGEFEHILAVLAMPHNTFDRISNEAVLATVLPRARKLSVVLRCEGAPPSVAALRRYVGTIYSQLWDCTVLDSQSPDLPDVVVYPAHLPNAAPESWIAIQRDLDGVCGRDETLGWDSEAAAGEGLAHQRGEGRGGLMEHVRSVNAERKSRGLRPVRACPVDAKRLVSRNEHVVYLEDEEDDRPAKPTDDDDSSSASSFFGGSRQTPRLFESVAVGGTFDGMHYGHRKLLTLAVSSVEPFSGRLLVGVTQDAMLAQKAYAAYIPSYAERVQGVRDFLARLAPGMLNRVQVVPLEDNFGPPGHADTYFDALVLSHETLETGLALNRHRIKHLGLHPLKLLCTERTEAHGMSSTQLRRLRARASEMVPE